MSVWTRLGGALQSLRNLLPGKGRKSEDVITPAEDVRTSTLAHEDTPNLDVAKFADEDMARVHEEATTTLVAAFDPETGDFRSILSKLAGWIGDSRMNYVNAAEAALEAAAKKLGEARKAVRAGTDPYTKFKTTAQMVFADKATRFCAAREEATRTAHILRRMNIGLMGSPDRVVNLTNAAMNTWFVVTYSIAALAMEFRLNLPILQGSSSREISALVSLILGLGTVIGVVYASQTRQERELHENAKREHEQYYKNKPGGRDPILGEPAEVFPLGAGHNFRFVLSHIIAFGIPIGLIVMRYFVIMRQPNPNVWGGMAGSFAFFVLALCMYVLKIHLSATPEKGRLEEYVQAKQNADAAAKTLADLQNPISDDEWGKQIAAAWTLYLMETGPAGNAELQAENALAHLRKQIDGEREYFVQAFELSARQLADAVEETGYTGILEVPEHPDRAFPELVTPPIRLPKVEEKPEGGPKAEQPTEWQSLAREMWRDELATAERHVAEEREAQVREAANQRKLQAVERMHSFNPTGGRRQGVRS